MHRALTVDDGSPYTGNRVSRGQSSRRLLARWASLKQNKTSSTPRRRTAPLPPPPSSSPPPEHAGTRAHCDNVHQTLPLPQSPDQRSPRASRPNSRPAAHQGTLPADRARGARAPIRRSPLAGPLRTSPPAPPPPPKKSTTYLPTLSRQQQHSPSTRPPPSPPSSKPPPPPPPPSPPSKPPSSSAKSASGASPSTASRVPSTRSPPSAPPSTPPWSPSSRRGPRAP